MSGHLKPWSAEGGGEEFSKIIIEQYQLINKYFSQGQNGGKAPVSFAFAILNRVMV